MTGKQLKQTQGKKGLYCSQHLKVQASSSLPAIPVKLLTWSPVGLFSSQAFPVLREVIHSLSTFGNHWVGFTQPTPRKSRVEKAWFPLENWSIRSTGNPCIYTSALISFDLTETFDIDDSFLKYGIFLLFLAFFVFSHLSCYSFSDLSKGYTWPSLWTTPNFFRPLVACSDSQLKKIHRESHHSII